MTTLGIDVMWSITARRTFLFPPSFAASSALLNSATTSSSDCTGNGSGTSTISAPARAMYACADRFTDPYA